MSGETREVGYSKLAVERGLGQAADLTPPTLDCPCELTAVGFLPLLALQVLFECGRACVQGHCTREAVCPAIWWVKCTKGVVSSHHTTLLSL